LSTEYAIIIKKQGE